MDGFIKFTITDIKFGDRVYHKRPRGYIYLGKVESMGRDEIVPDDDRLFWIITDKDQKKYKNPFPISPLIGCRDIYIDRRKRYQRLFTFWI